MFNFEKWTFIAQEALAARPGASGDLGRGGRRGVKSPGCLKTSLAAQRSRAGLPARPAG